MKIFILFLPIVFYGKFDGCSSSYLKGKLDFVVSLRSGNDRAKYDSYFENDLPIILGTLISCMDGKNFDKRKAKIFFDFFLSIRGHASEEVNSYLSKFFVGFQKDTREMILTYPKEKALYLAKKLKVSWDNITYGISVQGKSKEMPKDLLLLLQQLDIPIVNHEATPVHE